MPLLLDSYFHHPLNDHLVDGAIVWTTTAAQAKAASGYLQAHNATLRGPVVRDFALDARQWQVAPDSEQWYWVRDGKHCGDAGMCG